jgi:Ca-activated chloride channel family protein
MKLAMLILAATVLAAAPARATEVEGPPGTGALTAMGRDGRPLGACPLKHTDVHASISGFVARVVVTQTFENSLPDPIEAVYTFPLSERAAVDAMEIHTGGRTIRGDIKRREDARRIYDAARRAGQVAALLDQERPNIFTQSITNLMPGAAIEVRLEYVEPLPFRDGTFEFAFPTVVGPRFVPGTPTGHDGTGWAPDTDRVPDASRITPPVTPQGTRAGHDLAITVDVDAGVPIREVTSPLHAIDVVRPEPTRATVTLQRRDEIPNRDFVLRYAVASDQVQSGWLAHRDATGDGYVSLVLLPPKRVTATTAAPKELIFVIDRSGSQSGAPLDKAKETMRWILDHMNPNDTFQVVDFGSTANQLFPTPQLATPAMRTQARAYIDALEANGGTMMAEAVRAVCAMPADDHRLRVVTFMTDGYIGNDFEVIDLVRRLRATSRWFPFGTGNGVNRFLLDGMARAGGGEVDYVLLTDPGETVAARFWEKIANPVLTDVTVEFRGLDVVDVFPAAQADVWAERPLVIHARYRRAGSGTVVLRGYQQGRAVEQTLAVTLPEREPEHGAIASMWARAKVDDLMDQDMAALQSGTFPPALREQIVAVALAHRLLTQFTSFVAVEDRVVNEGGVQHTVTVPVEMPDGVRYEGVFGQDAAADRLQAAPAMPGAIGAVGRGAMQLAAKSAEAPPRTRKDESRQTASVLLDTESRGRLDADLQALVDGTADAKLAAAAAGGWVKVRIRLRDVGAETLRALQAAGFRIERRDDRSVTGAVAVEKLPTVAALPAVERIMLRRG